MSGLSARIAANAVWVLVFSVVVVLGATLTYAGGLIFDDKYTLTVPMPEGGGVLAGQEVTVMGRAVGIVEEVRLTQDGVDIELAIQDQFPVPKEARVRVLRRSPIGEQSVNFEPLQEQWEPAEKGARVVPVEALTPAEVPFLLEETADLFEAMDLEDVTIVFEEFANALRGRGELLRQFNRDSLDLNRTLVAGIPNFERAIESSDTVLEELSEHRQALAESFTNAADLTQTLAEQRPTMETLLDTGTSFLEEFDAFIDDDQSNLHCLMSDLTDVNELLLGPTSATGAPTRFYETKLDEVEMALDKHRSFFQSGYAIISQPDPLTGADWIRVLMLPPQEEHGEAHAERTPTPITKPGAACVTDEWGVGVNAVRQSGHQPPAATGGLDFAPLVEGGSRSGGSERDEATGQAPQSGEATTSTGEPPEAGTDRDPTAIDSQPQEPSGELSDTGKALLGLLLMLFLSSGIGVWLTRRR
ncbi:MAG: MCE family protein [Nitriliruptorales bacterium]|nr:MCE family protein [Nitriliruptorales bacterium]